MKKPVVISVIFILLLLAVSLIIVSAAEGETTTVQDVKDILNDNARLQENKDAINNILSQIPERFRNLFVQDAVYFGRVGYSNAQAVMKNGLITEISTSPPSKPTHYVDTSYDIAVRVANSERPHLALVVFLLDGDILISTASGCEDDIQCADNEVCVDKECKSAFTVVAVPLGYGSSEYSAFYEKAKPELDLFRNFLPIDKDYMRVHYVDPKVCPDFQCRDVCRDCQDKARECAVKSGLAGVADKVVAVSKGDVMTYYGTGQSLMLCGCAGGIPSFTSVSRSRLYVPEGVYCYNTVAHEAGHQLGLYHVDATGEEGGACQGPNVADCGQPNKKEFIMGYAWPQTTFGPAATNYLKTQLGVGR